MTKTNFLAHLENIIWPNVVASALAVWAVANVMISADSWKTSIVLISASFVVIALNY